jgi:biofilm PGA synthesis N-glycosyltransferase PgaC
MILGLILNILIVCRGDSGFIYQLVFLGQIAFYGMSVLGWIMMARQIKVKIFFIPYYFSMMNYAVIRGIFRYLSGNQSAIWEKAKRKQS